MHRLDNVLQGGSVAQDCHCRACKVDNSLNHAVVEEGKCKLPLLFVMGQVLKEVANAASFFKGLKITDGFKNVQCLVEECTALWSYLRPHFLSVHGEIHTDTHALQSDKKNRDNVDI